MAVTAREVIMVFRGQNYLSSSLRRIGRDVGGLSRTAQLSQQRAQLQIVGDRLRTTRSIAEAERRSIQTGSRAIAMKQAQARLSASEFESAQKLDRLYTQQNRNLIQRLSLQTKSEQISTALAGGPVRGVARGLTQPQLVRADQALRLARETNLAELQRLQAATLRQIALVDGESLEAQKLAARLAELAQREAILTQEINNTSRSLDLNTAKLEENAIAMRKVPWERFRTGAQLVGHAGRALQMFGLIGTAVFAGLAKYAADFNTQVTLAATQAIEPSNNSVQQIQRISAALSKGIVDILKSGTAVGSSQDFTKSAYDILSGITQLSDKSAVKMKQTLDLLKEFNLVTKANFGLVSFNQVTQAGITLMNTFGTTFQQLPHEFDVMQKAVNRGRLTLGQFTDGLNQTAAPAKAAGFTFDQMAGTLSFLSTKFPSYNRAAVGYARLVEILANPKFIAGLRAAGVSITDVTGKHLLPFDQIIQKLVKHFPQLQKGGLFVQNFFKQFSGQTGFIGARRAFTVAVQDLAGLEKFTRQIPQARGLVNASATALSQTGAVKWAELVTQLKAVAITIGQDVIPVFVTLLKPVQAAAHWFNNLSGHTQSLIAKIVAISAVVALLGGTLLAVVGGLAGFAATIGLAFGAFAPETVAAAAGIEEVSAGLTGATTNAALFSGEMTTMISIMSLLIDRADDLVKKLGGLRHIFSILARSLPGVGLLTLIPALSKADITRDVGKVENAMLKYTGIHAVTGLFGHPGGLGEYRDVGQTTGPNRLIRQSIRDSERLNQVAGNVQFKTDAQIKRRQTTIEYNRKLVASIPETIANIERLRSKMLGNPNDIKAAKAYEAAMIALQKRFKDHPALLAAINDVLGNYDQSIKNATKSTVTFEDALKGIESMYNSFKQTETGLFGSLFNGPFINSPTTQNRLQFGGRLTGRDLLKDLHSQVSNFQNFHNRLDNLRKRGAPQELINQLMAAGDDPESMRRLTALQSLKPQQLQEYFRTFQQGQRLIKQATMNDLKQQLKIYRQHGRNIALAIIAGLRDENVGLEKALTKMIKNMFPGLPTAATTGKTTTPPKKEDKKPVTHVKHEKNEYHFHGDVKDKHGVKTAIRHANHAKRSKYYDRGPGPR